MDRHKSTNKPGSSGVRLLPFFALLFCGCAGYPGASISGKCGFDNPGEWLALSRLPSERSMLLALLKGDEGYIQGVRRKPDGYTGWFAEAGGGRLGYCHLPEYPSSCNNYTVMFAQKYGSWSKAYPEGGAVICGS
jgi:hypothetical protein